jgi:hypothetical protein
VASSANLLAVDAEVVERLSATAENELQNVVKLFQRKFVRYRNQPHDQRADFQQYDPECQAISTKWGGHEPASDAFKEIVPPCSTLPSPVVTTDELLLRVNTADDG